jgi:hypothetical protein
MTSDRLKEPKKPNDIAVQFRELQQLRRQVHEAELKFPRKRKSSLRATEARDRD